MKDYMKTTGKILSLALCFAYLTGCSDDNKAINVPDNWVVLENNNLSCDYKKDTLRLDFTLASGLDESMVYVLNEEVSWCKGYIDKGQIIIAIAESTHFKERTAKMTFNYDATHAIDLTLTQDHAPIKVAEDINIANMPASINMAEPIDLNSILLPIPADASYNIFDYTVDDDDKDNLTIDENGLLIAYKSGSYTFEVATIDGSNLKKEVTVDVNTDFGRSAWTISTSASYTKNGVTTNYLPDGTTGLPEHMFDGSSATFFSMLKPGKSYNDYSAADDAELYFIIDLGTKATFNSFYLSHRNNTGTGLRVQGLAFYGSHDGKAFTEITNNVTIPTNVIEVGYKDLPESTYRYVKVEYTLWDKINSNSVQIGEFNLARN